MSCVLFCAKRRIEIELKREVGVVGVKYNMWLLYNGDYYYLFR